MSETAGRKGRLLTIALWIATAIPAFGIGLAGLTKFLQPTRWQSLFAGWGYPPAFATVVGVVEIIGAAGLLVPRFALYAAILLATVMIGALVTLLTHPGGPLGWGATPAFYLVLLTALATARWRRKQAHADESP
jgi:putative oxidoreductase